MKQFCIIILTCTILILSVIGIGLPKKESTEYLRIHIRANSNSEVDQEVKYSVKEKIVNYLTPILAECKTKKNAEAELTKNLDKIEEIADNVLLENGYDYLSNAKINNEKFPTRTYGNLTLSSGYYDALIIELGEAKGENWWCVVYPPLCFVEGDGAIYYRSKLLEIINEFIKSKEK